MHRDPSTIVSATARMLILAAAATAICFEARAADPPPASEAVVVPEVDRRDIRLPRFPSNDFMIGLYGGSYATQNFGTSMVGGVRLGYHITEDFFVEATYGKTTITDKAFRLVFPGAGVFPEEKQSLTYYDLSVAYNVLPGEVFLGGTRAKPAALYLIGGLGSTKVATQRRPTFNFGLGYRVFLNDHFALQVDLRDHVFSLDLLGVRESTQNIELTAGLAVFF
jgi:outer membrane beta-barrel protein